MCGRYTLIGDPGDLERRLGARFPGGTLVGNRYNVAPRQQIPIIERSEDGGPAGSQARWGLLAAWARTSKDRMQPVNARDDKLLASRMWKPLLQPAHRVLIPADGYYEWVRSEKGSERPAPFLHRVDGGEYFAFAGLLSVAEVEDLPDPIRTAAVVTTGSAGPAARIHDRMPAVLADRTSREAWLSPDLDPEEAVSLLEPFDGSRLTVVPASQLVNSVRNDGPELLDPDAPAGSSGA